MRKHRVKPENAALRPKRFKWVVVHHRNHERQRGSAQGAARAMHGVTTFWLMEVVARLLQTPTGDSTAGAPDAAHCSLCSLRGPRGSRLHAVCVSDVYGCPDRRCHSPAAPSTWAPRGCLRLPVPWLYWGAPWQRRTSSKKGQCFMRRPRRRVPLVVRRRGEAGAENQGQRAAAGPRGYPRWFGSLAAGRIPARREARTKLPGCWRAWPIGALCYTAVDETAGETGVQGEPIKLVRSCVECNCAPH
jgi:hypothetical protein